MVLVPCYFVQNSVGTPEDPGTTSCKTVFPRLSVLLTHFARPTFIHSSSILSPLHSFHSPPHPSPHLHRYRKVCSRLVERDRSNRALEQECASLRMENQVSDLPFNPSHAVAKHSQLNYKYEIFACHHYSSSLTPSTPPHTVATPPSSP